MVNQNKNNNLLYGIDDKPPMVETVVLGLQHYLTMFGSTLAIPLILSKPLGLEDKPVELGWLIVCGMAALNNVGWEVRMQHVQGAIIAGSVFEIGIGVTGLVGKLLRFVGPITIAPTIALIGLALFKFGAPMAGTHWPIGGLTIILIILFSQYLKSWYRSIELYPILLAILTAWAVAAIFTILGVFTESHPSFTSMENHPGFGYHIRCSGGFRSLE